MKKWISLILAVILAAVLACTAAADEVPQPEGGKKFETNWAIFDMTVEINYEEEGYRVYIRGWDPYELTGTEWEYSCFYNEEKDALLSVSSFKNSIKVDLQSGYDERGPYEYEGLDEEDQTTVFRINENGCLIWEDGRGTDGMDLEFTNIGNFKGFWRSEDGLTWAEIAWNDSEIGDEYGYNVFCHDGDDECYAEYSMHGLYNPETGKLETTGSLIIYRRNAEGGYDMEEYPLDPEEPTEMIFSELGNGKILLERDNGIELIYDFLGGDSQG